jgi:cellulose synthase/poly-beta-1,6-N-acetylglucosamine synthase-like glycosyltransferase
VSDPILAIPLAAALAAAVLFAISLRTHLRRRLAPRLAEASAEVEQATVLLPVRDEEENVGDCLASLLAQTARPAVVVIDDGSTDGTAAIVRRVQRSAPRVRLLDAGPLPPGWRGKVHALFVGSKVVETPWVLSTDADTRHHPDLLARALATARERRLDSLSVAGFQEVRGFGEGLMVPAVFALLDTLLGRWDDAAGGECRIANGQFILLRREALEAIGGFASIRKDARVDDVALVAHLRDRGFRHAFLRAPDLLRVRMYRGLGESFRGWRRNLGALGEGRLGRLLALLGPLLLPPLLLLGMPAVGELAVAGLAWALGAAASALFRRGSGHRPWMGIFYPLDGLLVAACLAAGFLDYRRGRFASWKGRDVPLEP